MSKKALTAVTVAMLIFAVFASSSATASPGLSPPQFSIRSIGHFALGTSSSASAINNWGQVTGYVNRYRPHSPFHACLGEAFIYSHGKLICLGMPAGARDSFGEAINDRGEVAVSVERADRQGHLMVFLATVNGNGHVAWRKLPEPSGPYPYGAPAGLNDGGMVVGESPAFDVTHAAVWQLSKGMYRLNRNFVPQSHMSTMTAVDNHGDIAGVDLGVSTQQLHALLWMGSIQPIDLSCVRYSGPAPGYCVRWKPAFVNGVARTRAAVQAVGEQFKSPDSLPGIGVEWGYEFMAKSRYPLVLTSTLPLLPGYSGSVATGVNSNGWIVGQMQTFVGDHPATRQIRPSKGSEVNGPAILWWRGSVYNLNKLIPPGSGWTLQQATGINCHGQIVGDGVYHSRQTAFLLTPSK